MIKTYKNILIFLFVSSYFSYLFTYLGIVVNRALAPLNFIILSIILTSVLVFSDNKAINYIAKAPIYRWMFFYFTVILIWVMLPNAQADFKYTRRLILGIIFMFTMSTLMYFDDNKLTLTRKAVLLATLLAIFNNIYEFFNPEAFIPISSPHYIPGRSAGFYLNANLSGAAINLGLIFSYNLVPAKFRVIFLFASLIGILASFSRTGIASWFMIVFLLSWTKVIERKIVFVATMGVVIGILLGLPLLLYYIDTNVEGSSNLLNRLDFFSSNENGLDASQRDRMHLAVKAFNYFADKPLVGNGIGFLDNWEFGTKPHNIYLKLMIEHGFIGIFIYLFLLLATVWKATGEALKLSFSFIAYMLITGFTTHNHLDAYQYLIAFSIMATMSYKSRTPEYLR